MSMELLTALALFALASSITPGPNNLMLMASGANFGFRRSIPHMLGIGIGFVVMLLLVGAGLAGVFLTFPMAHTVLKALSVLYLLWLAWKIANSAPRASDADVSHPLTFLQAAAFQWVNPKAWTMALTATTVYTPDRSINAILIVALTFGLINLPCVSSWTLLGQAMARVLQNRRQLRIFNVTMALMLVASLYPVLFA